MLGSGGFAVIDAPGFVAGLDDVAMMGEPVEQRGRRFRISATEDHLPKETEVLRGGKSYNNDNVR